MAKQGRKPIHLEMIGAKGNRQRIWESLRAARSGRTYSELAASAAVDVGAVRSYIHALSKAGFVTVTAAGQFADSTVTLLRDCGCEAPAIKRDGTVSSAGLKTEAIWRSLRILGDVDAVELTEQVVAAVGKASLDSTLQYIKWLQRAGYLQVVTPAIGGPNGRRARYRLAHGKYTGPKPPMIQRGKQVYDPNLGEVVYRHAVESAGEPA